MDRLAGHDHPVACDVPLQGLSSLRRGIVEKVWRNETKVAPAED